MALLPQLTRHIGQPLFLPAHGRGAALPDGLRQLLRRRAGIWDLPELPAIGERFSLLRRSPSTLAAAQGTPSVAAAAAGGQQQRTGAGGLQQAQAAFHTYGIQTLPLQPEHRRLR